MRSSMLLLSVLCVVRADAAAQRPLNLLFYGNSYSLDNATVPAMVKAIAAEAGQPTPNVVPRLFGGSSLAFHRNDPEQVAAIANSLPPGETWDYVVIQGLSVEATVDQGDPVAFRANALGIATNVRAHSPAARVILFQTWARGLGHAFYPAAFPGPLAMHNEVHANYALAAEDLGRAFGSGTARVARAGEAVARLAFAPGYYHPDLSHPAREMTLLAAMTIYSAIWQAPVYPLSPDFTGTGLLANHFRAQGYWAGQWYAMRGYADMVADRAVRRCPGSGEDLLVRVSTTSPDAAALVRVANGARVTLSLRSPNGIYSGSFGALVLDAVPAGPNPVWPEMWFGPTAVVLAAGIVGGGLNFSAALPPHDDPVLLQGFALGASTRMGGRWFTCTDAQQIVVE